ncbi:neuromodulin [Erpetoichthys calabaricus]|uniref:Neuromodulin n=1 Tax=Erpetoichthys calabaricus TaxID=27687 RepID=A0A8C4RFA7_ERPCA|nr:neuromodulin [Erpetoichthys calabaricus]
MLCCIRRTKQVEKNDEADQKIEQDGNKPEDKAHKAATKIQASFRGHIIRKKLKDGKKEDGPAAKGEAKAASEDKKEASSPAVENKDGPLDAAPQQNAANADTKTEDGEKATSTDAAPATASKDDGGPAAGTDSSGKAKDSSATSEEKQVAESENKEAPPAEEGTATPNASTESAPLPNAVETTEKEEPKQADVPAVEAKETTPKAQSEGTDTSQQQDKKDAAEESKPTESAQPDKVQNEEPKADQGNA